MATFFKCESGDETTLVVDCDTRTVYIDMYRDHSGVGASYVSVSPDTVDAIAAALHAAAEKVRARNGKESAG